MNGGVNGGVVGGRSLLRSGLGVLLELVDLLLVVEDLLLGVEDLLLGVEVVDLLLVVLNLRRLLCVLLHGLYILHRLYMLLLVDVHLLSMDLSRLHNSRVLPSLVLHLPPVRHRVMLLLLMLLTPSLLHVANLHILLSDLFSMSDLSSIIYLSRISIRYNHRSAIFDPTGNIFQFLVDDSDRGRDLNWSELRGGLGVVLSDMGVTVAGADGGGQLRLELLGVLGEGRGDGRGLAGV